MIRMLAKNALRYERTINLRWTRCLSSGQLASEGEKRIASLLKENFPKATTISVTDISGGCGAMYEIIVESSEFHGLRTVQQHRLVHKVVEHEVKAIHGVRILTSVPSE